MQDQQSSDPRVRNAERPVVTADECGASAAAQTWRPLVQPGMYVYDEHGDDLGQVKEVRAGDFLLDRPSSPGKAAGAAIYLPYERIHAIMADQITLDLPCSQLDEHGSVPEPLNL